MTDLFERFRVQPHAPATVSELVDVSSGDHEFTNHTRLIYVAAAGNATIRLIGDEADLELTGLIAGTQLPIRVSHVRETGTTASLVGFW